MLKLSVIRFNKAKENAAYRYLCNALVSAI